MNTCSRPGFLLLFVVFFTFSATAIAQEPVERQLGVRAPPEQVFMRPVAEIIPELKGATATGVNGRVGTELVFWGYTLASGKAVNLYGCADVKGVDCQARLPLICAKGDGVSLNYVMESGDIVQRICQPVGKASVGDLHPGCTDNEIQNNLHVGLVSCPGS